MIALAVLIVGIMFGLEIFSKNGQKFKNVQKQHLKPNNYINMTFFRKCNQNVTSA